jgi:hypothetical protein
MELTMVGDLQMDRDTVLQHLKSLLSSDDLEMKGVHNQDDNSFEFTMKVPVTNANAAAVNRITALSVDSLL